MRGESERQKERHRVKESVLRDRYSHIIIFSFENIGRFNGDNVRDTVF